MRNSGNNFGFFAAVPKDILRMIMRDLSPGDWGRANLVCRFWHQQANHFSVKMSLSEKIIPWIIDHHDKSFNKLNPFIKKHELISFLKSDHLPIPVKIIVLYELKKNKSRFFSSDFFFPETVKIMSKKIQQEILTEIGNFIEAVAVYLIFAYRFLSANMKTVDLSSQFDNEVRIFFHAPITKDPHLRLSEGLQSLLIGETQNNTDLYQLNTAVNNTRAYIRKRATFYVFFTHFAAFAAIGLGSGGGVLVGKYFTTDEISSFFFVVGLIMLIFSAIILPPSIIGSFRAIKAFKSTNQENPNIANSAGDDNEVVEFALEPEPTEHTPLTWSYNPW